MICAPFYPLAELSTSRALRKKGGSKIDTEALKIYVGTYGARTVFLEGDKLRYRRQGGLAIDLIPISDDTFRLRTPPVSSQRSHSPRESISFCFLRHETNQQSESITGRATTVICVPFQPDAAEHLSLVELRPI